MAVSSNEARVDPRVVAGQEGCYSCSGCPRVREALDSVRSSELAGAANVEADEISVWADDGADADATFSAGESLLADCLVSAPANFTDARGGTGLRCGIGGGGARGSPVVAMTIDAAAGEVAGRSAPPTTLHANDRASAVAATPPTTPASRFSRRGLSTVLFATVHAPIVYRAQVRLLG
jgi:hypothetical protein